MLRCLFMGPCIGQYWYSGQTKTGKLEGKSRTVNSFLAVIALQKFAGDLPQVKVKLFQHTKITLYNMLFLKYPGLMKDKIFCGFDRLS